MLQFENYSLERKFGIFNKVTGQRLVCKSGKFEWKNKGHAKNAIRTHLDTIRHYKNRHYHTVVNEKDYILTTSEIQGGKYIEKVFLVINHTKFEFASKKAIYDYIFNDLIEIREV